jgi:hypothetical protein
MVWTETPIRAAAWVMVSSPSLAGREDGIL